MRFRRKEWDVPMPAALVAYWTAWNEAVLGRIRGHLDLAGTESIEWNDPRDSFVGIDELEAAVKRLRSSKPEYVFNIASEIDHHHDRLRYRWDMTRNGCTLMRDSTSPPSTRRPVSSPESTDSSATRHHDASEVPKALQPVAASEVAP